MQKEPKVTRSRRSKGEQGSKDKLQWYRMDLHLHTPGSKDYQDPQATYLDILKKAEAEGLDIIAFTDHNTIAGYSAMMQEISDLERWESGERLRPEEKERLQEYRRLREEVLVLAGFELTVTFGFHILAIFAPQTPVRSIEHVLLRLNVPFASLDLGATEVGPTSDVLTAYRVMAEAGALVIAAHANSSNGVAMFGLDFGGQTKIAYTQDPNLHALEVTDLEARRRRNTASFFSGAKPEYPRRMHCIQGSDAHSIKGNKNNLGVGERATEVLLPEVSFKALKELFLGNDFSRTRPYLKEEEPFDFVEAARKIGPSLVQSFHEQMSRQGGRLHAIVRDVVAFANTNGGTIYVGAAPNAKIPPKGLENPEEALAELRTEIEHQVTPPIELRYSIIKSQGVSVLRVETPKGDNIPYVLEGSKIYIRKEAETSLAMRDEIVALIRQTLGSQPAAPGKQARPPKPARPMPTTPPATEAQPAPVIEQHIVASEPIELPAASPVPVETATLSAEHPHTGVEIIDSVERKGVKYHTMRDMRDGSEVHNVSRASARRLWRYAIALKEKHTFQEDRVTWSGDLGLWHKYLRAGRPHYDLVQRDSAGKIHIYYGVTEEGIHGPWQAVVGMDESIATQATDHTESVEDAATSVLDE